MGWSPKREWKEAKEASVEMWQWGRRKNWKTLARESVRLKHWWKWALAIAFIVGAVVFSHYHNKIVLAFEPYKDDIVEWPTSISFNISWIFPILILVIISFPPLFGHELVLLIVGLIWDLWVGFGIAAAGTFIGELLTFYAFKYWFTGYARKIEEGSIMYACLARLMRDGGVFIIILVRFSVLPGHIVTAIQSTVGMPVWIYCIAVLVSMPKQLVVVYLGVLFGTSTATGASPEDVKRERIISLSVFFVTTLMTVIAAYVVYIRARRLYPEILAESLARKEAKKLAAGGGGEGSDNGPPSGFEGPYATTIEVSGGGGVPGSRGYENYGSTSDIHAPPYPYGSTSNIPLRATEFGGGGGGGGAEREEEEQEQGGGQYPYRHEYSIPYEEEHPYQQSQRGRHAHHPSALQPGAGRQSKPERGSQDPFDDSHGGGGGGHGYKERGPRFSPAAHEGGPRFSPVPTEEGFRIPVVR